MIYHFHPIDIGRVQLQSKNVQAKPETDKKYISSLLVKNNATMSFPSVIYSAQWRIVCSEWLFQSRIKKKKWLFQSENRSQYNKSNNKQFPRTLQTVSTSNGYLDKPHSRIEAEFIWELNFRKDLDKLAAYYGNLLVETLNMHLQCPQMYYPSHPWPYNTQKVREQGMLNPTRI